MAGYLGALRVFDMTIRGLLESCAMRIPNNVAMRWCEDKTWKSKTWNQFYQEVREIAEGYATRFGLKPREENTAIILPNHPQWMISYLAQSGAGISVVPVDPKLHNEEVWYILNDAEVTVVTTDKAHLRMFMDIASRLPKLRGIVIIDGVIFDGQKIGQADVVGLKSLMIRDGGEWYDRNLAQPSDVASIIYTSGTTGKPKGAMLTHSNFLHDVVGALKCFGAKITEKDSFFVVLPLFHAFSFLANFVCPMIVGAQICFMQSLRTVVQDIKTLKPSVMMAVPLLAEKIYQKIEEALASSKAAKFLFKIGLRGPIMHMVKLRLGGRIRFMVTGGAPCPHHVLKGFNRMHIRFLEGYGLTECSPVVSVCGPEIDAVGSLGKAIAGIQVRLDQPNEAGVGELQVKGPIVMKGYFHNENATKEAFTEDGWFMTGDLASIDEQGVISIRGRKKALIVNREGKNIYPEEVENCIAKELCVADILVLGYTEGGVPGERVGAIAHPSEEWFKAQNDGKLPAWEEMEKVAMKAVQTRCAELADYKRPRKVVISKEPLERTSVGKIRRVAYKGKLDE